MEKGPTTGAEQRSWTAKPVNAVVLRGLIGVAPIVAAYCVARFTAAALWYPGGFAGTLAYFLQIAVVGSGTALLADRVARRAVPLTLLLNMTLVFPDRAPSRFGLALRTGTLRRLQKSIETGEAHLSTDHQKAAEQLVEMVVALGRHERLTRGHTERVRAYVDVIAEEMDLPAADRQKLQWAALAHDVGKLAVPPEILNSTGRPTDDEWKILSSHPAIGGEMIEPLADWLGDWRFAASQHHERWDGEGYPLGLKGTEISLAGRVVAVADAYDVITSTRSYKKALSAETAREEMVRCAGSQFDADVVRALLNGSLARHSTRVGFVGWLIGWAERLAVPQIVAQGAVGAATVAAVSVGALTGPSKVPPIDQDVVESAIEATSSDGTPDTLPFVVGDDVDDPDSASSGPTTVTTDGEAQTSTENDGSAPDSPTSGAGPTTTAVPSATTSTTRSVTTIVPNQTTTSIRLPGVTLPPITTTSTVAPATLPTTTTTTVPAGVQFGNSVYALGTPGQTWKQARAEATAAGGHLVTITSASENEFIRSTFLGSGSSVWLGFTDEGSEGTFAWITGEPFTYTNWIPGALLIPAEPFDLLGTSDFGAMSSSSGGWEDSINLLPSWSTGLAWLPSGPAITVIEYDL